MGERDQDVMSVVSPELADTLTRPERPMLKGIEFAARTASRPARPLQLQALLQLPRLADANGRVPDQASQQLLAELAQELPQGIEWFVPDAGSSPRRLHFHEVDVETARDVMRRFHYLRSPRIDGRAHGLSTPEGRLVALCVSSPLDVGRLSELLASIERPSESARVISRVFAFDGAPKNSISYMLSRVAEAERQNGVSDLITYVNPNMGFTGSSYLASGWRLIGAEPGTKYRYLDGRYVTDRELAAKFGPLDDEGYRRLLGARFATSVLPLKPLLVFHMDISPKKRVSAQRAMGARRGAGAANGGLYVRGP
jgi:hypothetical protein